MIFLPVTLGFFAERYRALFPSEILVRSGAMRVQLSEKIFVCINDNV
jgi:hypothetical protein